MRIFHKFSKIEKLLIIFLFLTVFFSISKISYNYFEDNSYSQKDFWWTYSESLVWNIGFLNPVFNNLNQVDKDISYFLFEWLMKYQNWKIINNIANHTLSEDKLTYIFKIKPNIFWHDWKKMTVDDVYFTYHDILQSPDFENKNLSAWLIWVKIEKKSDDEISFTLKKPYKFFLSNLTIWILPKHILSTVPVENLKYSDFNFENPVGLWPYKFSKIQNFWDYKKVFLTKNKNFFDKNKKFYIENLEFFVFKDRETQKKYANNFLGFWPIQKPIDKKNNEKTFNLSWFEVYKFFQRKTVWLFLNTESEFLKNPKTRLWLQLAINKKELIEKIWEEKIVNTPFLELKNDWSFDFNQKKAMWALHDAWWNLPEKVQIKQDDEEFKNNDTKYIFSHKKSIFSTSSWSFFLNWNAPEKAVAIYVNDYKLRQFKKWNKIFSYKLNTKIWTLKEWKNDYIIKAKMENWDYEILDVMQIFYFKNEEEVAKKQREINSWEIRWILKKIKKNQDIKKNLDIAEKFDFRVNSDWKILKLKLITDKRIEKYRIIAENLKKYFKNIWVDLEVENLDFKDFVEKINNRDYDILLYWQAMWYNLDTYPFFHSSEAWKWWLNFSNLKDPEFDVLIEKIRSSHDEKERSEWLKKLWEKFKTEVPAIYLYSPEYYYQISKHVKWVKLWDISNAEDRFSEFSEWYINEKKNIKKDVNFFSWIKEIFAK